ncbi:MAG: hypothetical protein EZS28_034795 [Streblomastix strix]|uniref:Uncharacterized protein n=1 Tax=Streblomastix strix TaxID=222440 RepID=A0A5J4UG90_9EUKA|nr:MAG: hypothetical protein EZS28_034795 [Streblomastix strix]
MIFWLLFIVPLFAERLNIFWECEKIEQDLENRTASSKADIHTKEQVLQYYNTDCILMKDFVYKGKINPHNRLELCNFLRETMDQKLSFNDTVKEIEEANKRSCFGLVNETLGQDKAVAIVCIILELSFISFIGIVVLIKCFGRRRKYKPIKIQGSPFHESTS